MKFYDSKEKAKHLAKVIRYNRDLFEDEGKFEDAVVALQVNLIEAFNAGANGAREIESVFDSKEVSPESMNVGFSLPPTRS